MEKQVNEYQGKMSGTYYQHKSNTKRILWIIAMTVGLLVLFTLLGNASVEPTINKAELEGVVKISCDKSQKLMYQLIGEELGKEQPDMAKIKLWTGIAELNCSDRLNSLFPTVDSQPQ